MTGRLRFVRLRPLPPRPDPPRVPHGKPLEEMTLPTVLYL
jgi:hypothetical protein